MFGKPLFGKQIMKHLTSLVIATAFLFSTKAIGQEPEQQTNSICLSTCVQLEQPAKRVVALNWSAIEILLSLGVKPVGVTQGKGYRKWQSNHPELPEGITEVGRRQEPDLISIAKLQPDLIIGYDFRHARLHKALSRLAPTLLYQQFPQKYSEQQASDFTYFNAIPEIYRGIAKAVGRSEQAESKLKKMFVQIENMQEQLYRAGLSNHPISYAKFVGMGYGLRVFGPKSLAGSIAKELGLNYQWHRTLPGKDFTHLQLEQMSELSGSHIILADNQTNNDRIITSPVWHALPFVKQGQVSNTPALWSFGGPDSAIRMAKAFTQSLLKWQSKQAQVMEDGE